MIWYKINTYSTNIEQVEVVKETGKFVDVKPYSNRNDIVRRSKSDGYFPTFEKAKQYMIDFRLARIEKLKREIANLEQQIENVSLLENNNE